MLARKFVRYRLRMAGITQNKLKSLIFIEVPQGRKSVSRIRSKKRKGRKKNEHEKNK